ncbi:ABC transporter permease [Microbacterium sp. 18062]|uniref:ABC transporter permease n=1 Tax=Microbacterium sp. 18062 TaxID=2681410 RepID=UPI001357D5DD|nr:ABC transporter permease [Microbacterium sp. 18062]
MTTTTPTSTTRTRPAGQTTRRLFNAVALPLLLLTIWWFASAGSTSLNFPPLSAIFDAFAKMWIGPGFVANIVPTVARIVGGFLVAVVLGVALGVVLGLNARIRQAVEPLLEFFRALPPPVLVPIFIIFLGLGDDMRIVVIAVGAIWPILLNTVEGVKGYDRVLSDTCASFGVRGWRRMTELILPSALPQIVAGMRTALSIAIIMAIISEMFGGTNGVGQAIIYAQRRFDTPEMWSGVLVLGLIGSGLALLFRIFERRVLSWYEGLKGLEKR